VALLVVGAALLAGARPLLLIGFDRDGAAAAGMAVTRWDIVLLLTIEVAVVTLVPAVGTILAVSLIVAPAAAARLVSERLAVITALAVVFAVVSGLGGLWMSSRWNVAAGASISLVATTVLALAWVSTRVRAIPDGLVATARRARTAQ
jgi:ABC-type Mn2+/Zn2+ transport system permease subunit